jgi:hypothetical protein
MLKFNGSKLIIHFRRSLKATANIDSPRVVSKEKGKIFWLNI